MEEKFVENDFFKNFGQKWKVRNGTDFYFFKLKKKDFCQAMAFSTEVWRRLSSDHVVQCQWKEMCWWCSWWSAWGCQGFHKEAWWELDQVHKTWQMHCWLFLRQIHRWQTQTLARDFQRKRYQGKQLGLEEENCFWWCGFSQWSNQKRHSEGRQSQMLKEEVKICFCRGWCWSFKRAVYGLC